MVFASKPPAELGFTSVAVERQDLVLIVPRDHPLANRHSVDLRETLPYPQVYFSEGSGRAAWWTSSSPAPAGSRRSPTR